MKICPIPKTRSKMLPWWIPLVTAPPMEAKNKAANQTKSHHPIQTPQAWTNRKGSNKKNQPKLMQCKVMPPRNHLKDGVHVPP